MIIGSILSLLAVWVYFACRADICSKCDRRGMRKRYSSSDYWYECSKCKYKSIPMHYSDRDGAWY